MYKSCSLNSTASGASAAPNDHPLTLRPSPASHLETPFQPWQVTAPSNRCRPSKASFFVASDLTGSTLEGLAEHEQLRLVVD